MIERHSGDPHLAEDITQETFLRVYRAGVCFDSSVTARKWFRIVAARLYANACRDRQTAERAEAAAARRAPLWEQDPSERSVHWAVEILAPLGPRHRRALSLKYVEGLTYEEVRAIERLSNRAVYSLLERARSHLRRALDEPVKGSSEHDEAVAFPPHPREG